MDSRIAAELLYESEATLRMVDTVLDELRISDASARFMGQQLTTLDPGGQTQTAEIEIPSEFCVRAYWQIQEALECVQHSREALQLGAREEMSGEPGNERQEQRERIDRALALLDRLESLEAGADDRSSIHRELRHDLVGILNRAQRRTERGESISLATSLIAEAEARLTRLGNSFATVQ